MEHFVTNENHNFNWDQKKAVDKENSLKRILIKLLKFTHALWNMAP